MFTIRCLLEEENNEKILVGLLVLLLSFASLGFTNNPNSQGNFDVILGVADLNLDIYGTTFNSDVSAELEIINFVINDSKIKLIGNVKYNDMKLDLRMDGSVGKSYRNNGVIGILEDKADNFDVVYFSINGENEKTINLYLMRKDTREFLMFEDKIKNIKGTEKAILSLMDKDLSEVLTDEEVFKEDFWYTKIIEPIEESIIEFEPETGTKYEYIEVNKSIIDSSDSFNDFSPMSISVDVIEYRWNYSNFTAVYTQKYSFWFKANEFHKIRFNRTMWHTFEGSNTNFSHRSFVELADKWVENSNGSRIAETNNLKLGHFGSNPRPIVMTHTTIGTDAPKNREYQVNLNNVTRDTSTSIIFRVGGIIQHIPVIGDAAQMLKAGLDIAIEIARNYSSNRSIGNFSESAWYLPPGGGQQSTSISVRYTGYELREKSSNVGLRANLQQYNTTSVRQGHFGTVFEIPIYSGNTHRMTFERLDGLRYRQ